MSQHVAIYEMITDSIVRLGPLPFNDGWSWTPWSLPTSRPPSPYHQIRCPIHGQGARLGSSSTSWRTIVGDANAQGRGVSADDRRNGVPAPKHVRARGHHDQGFRLTAWRVVAPEARRRGRGIQR